MKKKRTNQNSLFILILISIVLIALSYNLGLKKGVKEDKSAVPTSASESAVRSPRGGNVFVEEPNGIIKVQKYNAEKGIYVDVGRIDASKLGIPNDIIWGSDGKDIVFTVPIENKIAVPIGYNFYVSDIYGTHIDKVGTYNLTNNAYFMPLIGYYADSKLIAFYTEDAFPTVQAGSFTILHTDTGKFDNFKEVPQDNPGFKAGITVASSIDGQKYVFADNNSLYSFDLNTKNVSRIFTAPQGTGNNMINIQDSRVNDLKKQPIYFENSVPLQISYSNVQSFLYNANTNSLEAVKLDKLK
ncbi:MAG TPA: hypothetical protein VG917_06175 [Patescibacteria group bacterium]|nr:hypothetical protein [Patescibacteria group bacterium]